MKTLFFKNGIAAAAVVAAITGAFATTGQSASKSFAPRVGFTLNAQGECNMAVACDDNPSLFICRVGTSGPIAYGKNPQGQCVESLWRPQ